MAETIETGLVYIYRIQPRNAFVGCGAVIEGSYIATCRHVWRAATGDAGNGAGDQALQVEIEYPRSRENGAPVRTTARLVDACQEPDRPAPDLVLLEPKNIPNGVMPLHLAAHDRFEVGAGYAHARLARTDPNRGEIWRDSFPNGEIDPNTTDEGLRQFTGREMGGYWFTTGSSGSPVFLTVGQQLAGILSLSELGANEGVSQLHVAFVVPATLIRAFVAQRAATAVAASRGVDPAALRPILDALGIEDVPIAEIPTRLMQFVDEALARAAEPVAVSNDGADIEAVIGASRDKLRGLDAQGARNLLQAKIDEEIEARARRLVPLLRERAAIERLSSDHESAKSTLAEITGLTPDDVWPGSILAIYGG